MNGDLPPPRIVSLLPAATEIVCALGFQDQLVGRSHECDFPPGIEFLPVCTRSLMCPDGSSRDIDNAVKAALERAVSIYEVIGDTLQQLHPTVIVTQDQCEVCAVALRDVEAAVCTLLDQSVAIVSLQPEGLGKVFDDIRRVAVALDATGAGDALIAGMTERLQSVRARCADKTCPVVACIEWADPLMAAGNWVPELVEIAGGRDPFGQAGKHAPWLEPEKLFAEDPDVIVFMPCGFGLERSEAEARALLGQPEWQALKAVANYRVYATDGNSYFNRPGPRLVESAEILAEILHPELRTTVYEGYGWRIVRAN